MSNDPSACYQRTLGRAALKAGLAKRSSITQKTTRVENPEPIVYPYKALFHNRLPRGASLRDVADCYEQDSEEIPDSSS